MSDERRQLEEMLSAYLDGELDAAGQLEAERRLARDPYARQVLADLRALQEGLRQLPRTKASDELMENLRARLERQALIGDAARPTARARSRPRYGQWLAAAAVLGLAVTGGYVLWSMQREGPPQGPQFAMRDESPPIPAVTSEGRPARDRHEPAEADTPAEGSPPSISGQLSVPPPAPSATPEAKPATPTHAKAAPDTQDRAAGESAVTAAPADSTDEPPAEDGLAAEAESLQDNVLTAIQEVSNDDLSKPQAIADATGASPPAKTVGHWRDRTQIHVVLPNQPASVDEQDQVESTPTGGQDRQFGTLALGKESAATQPAGRSVQDQPVGDLVNLMDVFSAGNVDSDGEAGGSASWPVLRLPTSETQLEFATAEPNSVWEPTSPAGIGQAGTAAVQPTLSMANTPAAATQPAASRPAATQPAEVEPATQPAEPASRPADLNPQ